MRENIAFLFCLFVLLLLPSRSVVACGAGSAEAAYTAALLRCVDQSATLAESKECRRHVDGNYGITVTVKDAGR